MSSIWDDPKLAGVDLLKVYQEAKKAFPDKPYVTMAEHLGRVYGVEVTPKQAASKVYYLKERQALNHVSNCKCHCEDEPVVCEDREEKVQNTDYLNIKSNLIKNKKGEDFDMSKCSYDLIDWEKFIRLVDDIMVRKRFLFDGSMNDLFTHLGTFYGVSGKTLSSRYYTEKTKAQKKKTYIDELKKISQELAEKESNFREELKKVRNEAAAEVEGLEEKYERLEIAYTQISSLNPFQFIKWWFITKNIVKSVKRFFKGEW